MIATPHADLSPALKARDSKGPSSDGDGDGDGDGAILVPMVAHALRSEGFDASEDGTGRGTPLVPIAFAQNQMGEVRTSEVVGTLNTNANASGRNTPMAMNGTAVRRLTPRECARLQGFPDDYLDITFRGKPASDSVKYKALGNSMAVNCMRWIGARIQMVDAIERQARDAA